MVRLVSVGKVVLAAFYVVLSPLSAINMNAGSARFPTIVKIRSKGTRDSAERQTLLSSPIQQCLSAATGLKRADRSKPAGHTVRQSSNETPSSWLK
jgi:hypothetical protein